MNQPTDKSEPEPIAEEIEQLSSDELVEAEIPSQLAVSERSLRDNIQRANCLHRSPSSWRSPLLKPVNFRLRNRSVPLFEVWTVYTSSLLALRRIACGHALEALPIANPEYPKQALNCFDIRASSESL